MSAAKAGKLQKYLNYSSFLTSAHCFLYHEASSNKLVYKDPADDDSIFVIGGMYNWCLQHGKCSINNFNKKNPSNEKLSTYFKTERTQQKSNIILWRYQVLVTNGTSDSMNYSKLCMKKDRLALKSWLFFIDYDIGVGFLERPFQKTAFVSPVSTILKAGAQGSPNDLHVALALKHQFVAMSGMGHANKTYLCMDAVVV